MRSEQCGKVGKVEIKCLILKIDRWQSWQSWDLKYIVFQYYGKVGKVGASFEGI